MTTLDEIALKYGTDKSCAEHDYTRIYEKYFEPIRNEKLKLLEIGVQNGFSMKLWKEYFPNAEIYGIDIDEKCRQYEEDRVHIFIGNSVNYAFINWLNTAHGPFDIIIDDGSHHNLFTLLAFENIVPLVKKGGLYVIEDLHCSYWNEEEFGSHILMLRLQELLHQINAYGKSKYADKNKDTEENKINSFWEKEIESFTLYRSLAIIKRW